MTIIPETKRKICKKYVTSACKLIGSIGLPILLAFVVGVIITLIYQKQTLTILLWLNRISNDLLLALIGTQMYYCIVVFYTDYKLIKNLSYEKKKLTSKRRFVFITLQIVYLALLATLLWYYIHLTTNTIENYLCVIILTVILWSVALIACSVIYVILVSTSQKRGA